MKIIKHNDTSETIDKNNIAEHNSFGRHNDINDERMIVISKSKA